MNGRVRIDYYSDVLCVWAYVGHARSSELQSQFGEQLEWVWHYLPVFGDVPDRFLGQWQDRGGAAAYAEHVRGIIAEFGHVRLHGDCWETVQPASSAPAHLWLAAARLLERAGTLRARSEQRLAWAFRTAFFERALDIGRQSVLSQVVDELGLDSSLLKDRLGDGTAYAALCQDLQLARDSHIRVSPTYVFNEGRQRLAGNVGYRVIEANVRELLLQPDQQQSWC